MRHLVKKYKLNRDVNQRVALAKSLILAVMKNGKITTTRTKAKYIQPLIERCMSRAASGSLADVRFLINFMGENVTHSLVHKIAPTYTRSSGFSRIVPLGFRRGDNAEIVKLELIEKDIELVSEEKKLAKVQKKEKTDKIVEVKKQSVEKKNLKSKKLINKHSK